MISFILFSSWYEEMSYVKEYKGIYGHIQTMQWRADIDYKGCIK